MTEGKTAEELETMLLAALREHTACKAVTAVQVRPVGAHGDWRARVVAASEALPLDCDRVRRMVVHRLRLQFHLLLDGGT